MELKQRIREMILDLLELNYDSFNYKRVKETVEQLGYLHQAYSAVDVVEKTAKGFIKPMSEQLDDMRKAYGLDNEKQIKAVVKCIVCQNGEITDKGCSNPDCELNTKGHA